VGASGGGKSTIVDLITHLYDPSSGVVKVNVVDVQDLSTESLCAATAVVPQDTLLLNKTIMENIRCETSSISGSGVWAMLIWPGHA
jgi:ATP-binding cassette subfamily B protein